MFRVEGNWALRLAMVVVLACGDGKDGGGDGNDDDGSGSGAGAGAGSSGAGAGSSGAGAGTGASGAGGGADGSACPPECVDGLYELSLVAQSCQGPSRDQLCEDYFTVSVSDQGTVGEYFWASSDFSWSTTFSPGGCTAMLDGVGMGFDVTYTDDWLVFFGGGDMEVKGQRIRSDGLTCSCEYYGPQGYIDDFDAPTPCCSKYPSYALCQ